MTGKPKRKSAQNATWCPPLSGMTLGRMDRITRHARKTNRAECNAKALSETMERQGQAQLPVRLTRRPTMKNTQLSTILLFIF